MCVSAYIHILYVLQHKQASYDEVIELTSFFEYEMPYEKGSYLAAPV
jgi:hypothetical protein